jgi:hypothetical protein
MKKILLILMMLLTIPSFSQSIQITSMDAAPTSGGINVNLKTVSFNGAGFLGYNYTINENDITISACFWFNFTLPVLTFNNDFFIPVTDVGLYNVTVDAYNSASTETCDYFSTGGSMNTNVLSAPDFKNDDAFLLFPNPSGGIVSFTANPSEINGIHIYDNLGRLVRKYNKNIHNEIDLSGLANGMYFIRMNGNDYVSTQRIVKH